MRSRAQFKGHPIHPALVPFPFAFLTGALLFDLLGLMVDSPRLAATAAHLTLGGLAAGLLAAIPGLVDFRYTVPPRSSARTRAARHGLTNTVALALFAAAYATRHETLTPTTATLALELLGAAALAYAGWLGGVLVTRNLIGVDHRYAEAGRWQEAHVSGPAGSIPVGHVDDLKENQMKLLHVNGERIALARTADGYCAFEDRCSHRGGSLAGGVLIKGTVQCLWHGSQFAVTTGAVACGPAKAPIRVYQVTAAPDGRLSLAWRRE